MDDDEPGNFLDRFKSEAEVELETGTDGVSIDESVTESVQSTIAPRRTAEQALPASWEKPVCKECGREDGPEGGGRYGFDDHEGLFYCGHCWRSWDTAHKDEIMKPAYLQKRGLQEDEVAAYEQAGILTSEEAAQVAQVLSAQRKADDPEAFFARYDGSGAGSSDVVVGAWDPSQQPARRPGELELPGSFERPTCVECGKDEGDEGGGRYGHDADSNKFYCGRCWRSWDEESRRKIMMAYAPSTRWNDPAPSIDPMVICPCPPPPVFDDDFGFGPDPDPGFEDDDMYWREQGEDFNNDGTDLSPVAEGDEDAATVEPAGGSDTRAQALQEMPNLASSSGSLSLYAMGSADQPSSNEGRAQAGGYSVYSNF